MGPFNSKTQPAPVLGICIWKGLVLSLEKLVLVEGLQVIIEKKNIDKIAENQTFKCCAPHVYQTFTDK